MLELHPKFLKKNGKDEFVVLPYEEFVEVQRRLEDAEDILELRQAKTQEANAPALPLDEVKRRLGI